MEGGGDGETKGQLFLATKEDWIQPSIMGGRTAALHDTVSMDQDATLTGTIVDRHQYCC